MNAAKYPKRKPTRLRGYDYSEPNAYLVTICAYKRKSILGTVIPGDETELAVCSLSRYGQIAEQELLDLERRYPHVSVDNYVIMPNHIHVLITLDETEVKGGRPNVPDIFCTFKSLTTRKCRQAGLSEPHLFQGSFNDHIMRDEPHYLRTWHYIDINPQKWELDQYYDER